MPRKPIIRSSQHQYHVWARCNNKEWYQIPMPVVWSIYREVLKKAQKKYNIKISAFVLMNNHFHALIYTPEANLDAAMMYIMRQSSLAIGAVVGRINKIYGGRYRYTLILDDSLRAIMYKYVYRNPIKAGLCERVEQYPFSTFGNKKFPIHEDDFGRRLHREIEYLNTAEPTELLNALKRALKHCEMHSLLDRSTRRRMTLRPIFTDNIATI